MSALCGSPFLSMEDENYWSLPHREIPPLWREGKKKIVQAIVNYLCSINSLAYNYIINLGECNDYNDFIVRPVRRCCLINQEEGKKGLTLIGEREV